MHEQSVRVCCICGTEKPASEFYVRTDTGKVRKHCKACQILRQRFKSTGWTEERYQAIYAKQNGTCAICKVELNSSRYSRLSADHCHKTGKPRGLLCTPCNTAIGLMKDSPVRLMAAVEYLSQHTKNEEIVSSTGKPVAVERRIRPNDPD